MKRHPALIPFSREHHVVLQLAEGIKMSGPATLRQLLPEAHAARVAFVLQRFDEQVVPHLKQEEQLLDAPLRRAGKAGMELADRLVAEHAELRRLVTVLSQAKDLDTALDNLGRALVDHIRWEERELFASIPELLDASALAAIGAALGVDE